MQDADIGISAGNVLDHAERVALVQPEEHVLTVVVPRADVVEAVRGMREPCHGDCQAAAVLVHAVHEPVKIIHVLLEDTAVGKEVLSVFCEPGPLVGALEKREAGIVLERFYDMAELRL